MRLLTVMLLFALTPFAQTRGVHQRLEGAVAGARLPLLHGPELRSTAHCHLGNIGNRVGRELRFDPARMQFQGDTKANKLLTREYRKPYVVPDQV